ncbi:hypothetical protein BDP27DRAFT_1329606 [Rhodocollybia butyracea]|uniref:Uncharacterized protein n=1 Tax=Rhodocollybia butyracea TaxID=206335 RepID=A0A9P5PN94_9AGAR|nr:hypothetical protein BDP27DRAFT_1329606 [Rhodocollybia butyracea]
MNAYRDKISQGLSIWVVSMLLANVLQRLWGSTPDHSSSLISLGAGCSDATSIGAFTFCFVSRVPEDSSYMRVRRCAE